MRLFFLWAFLSSILGTLLGDLLPLWVALLIVFIPAVFKTSREFVILSLIGALFVIYPLKVQGSFEILGRSDISGRVVRIEAIWKDGRWVKLKGGFKYEAEGDRFYCYGMLKPVSRYPGYFFEGKCFPFTYRMNILEKLIHVSREKAETFQKEFYKIAPNVTGMVLSIKRREVYESGIAHVFAVSGFHIGIVFLIFRLVVQTFTYRFFLTETLPIFPTMIYSISVGFSPSSMRALLMISLRSLFKLIDYETHPLNVLGMAGFISMMFDPFLIYSPSFVLSHSATFGILLSLEKRSKWYFLPFYAFFYSLPFSLIFFKNIHILSPFLSLVAVPIASIGIFAGVMAYTLFWMGFENLARFVVEGSTPIDKTMGFLMDLGSKTPKLAFSPVWGILILMIVIIFTIRSIRLRYG